MIDPLMPRPTNPAERVGWCVVSEPSLRPLPGETELTELCEAFAPAPTTAPPTPVPTDPDCPPGTILCDDNICRVPGACSQSGEGRQEDGEDGSEEDSILMFVGIIVGSILGALLLLHIGFWCHRRRVSRKGKGMTD